MADVAERYVFDKENRTRFEALPRIYDPGTFRHLAALGVSEGWRCLEVGAGGGSVACWLADRVGPNGHVLATDINTHFLEPLAHSNLEVQQHDITTDPIPEATFDLVHARLLLCHLPTREEALARMVRALKPGGWLLIEDFDTLSLPDNPSINPVEGWSPLYPALIRTMTARGVDHLFGRTLPGRLRENGLVDIDGEARTFLMHRDGAWNDLLRGSVMQLRTEISSAEGWTEAEFDRHLAALDESDHVSPAPMMWAVWGRRPN